MKALQELWVGVGGALRLQEAEEARELLGDDIIVLLELLDLFLQVGDGLVLAVPVRTLGLADLRAAALGESVSVWDITARQNVALTSLGVSPTPVSLGRPRWGLAFLAGSSLICSLLSSSVSPLDRFLDLVGDPVSWADDLTGPPAVVVKMEAGLCSCLGLILGPLMRIGDPEVRRPADGPW